MSTKEQLIENLELLKSLIIKDVGILTIPNDNKTIDLSLAFEIEQTRTNTMALLDQYIKELESKI